LALAALTTGRRKELLAKDHASEQAFDEARLAEEALRAELAAAGASIARTEAQIESLAVTLERSTIAAPFDGTLTKRMADEGTTVRAGEAVLTVSETTAKEIRIGVPSGAAQPLRIGSVHEVAVSGRTYRATVRSVLPMIDHTTRTRTVILIPVDGSPASLPGEVARLLLNHALKDSGFWLPLSALTGGRRGQWTAYAFSRTAEGVDEGVVERREVQIIHAEAERAFVRGTIRDGELFVAHGLHRVVPGQRVRLSSVASAPETR